MAVLVDWRYQLRIIVEVHLSIDFPQAGGDSTSSLAYRIALQEQYEQKAHQEERVEEVPLACSHTKVCQR